MPRVNVTNRQSGWGEGRGQSCQKTYSNVIKPLEDNGSAFICHCNASFPFDEAEMASPLSSAVVCCPSDSIPNPSFVQHPISRGRCTTNFWAASASPGSINPIADGNAAVPTNLPATQCLSSATICAVHEGCAPKSWPSPNRTGATPTDFGKRISTAQGRHLRPWCDDLRVGFLIVVFVCFLKNGKKQHKIGTHGQTCTSVFVSQHPPPKKKKIKKNHNNIITTTQPKNNQRNSAFGVWGLHVYTL